MQKLSAWLRDHTWVAVWIALAITVVVAAASVPLPGPGIDDFGEWLGGVGAERVPLWTAVLGAALVGGAVWAVPRWPSRRASRAPRRPPVEIPDGEVTWVATPQRSYLWTTPPRPECTEHRGQELLARVHDKYSGKDQIKRITRSGVGQESSPWVLHCPADDGHDVEQSREDFWEASEVAQSQIEAAQRNR